jgi:hypothetical protein
MSWKLKEWNSVEYKTKIKPMTLKEIDKAICYLRCNSYPRPDDCPMSECPRYRPACSFGVCLIAVGMCGDF